MEAEPSPDSLPCSTASPLQPPLASCWSSVVQKKPAPVPPISSRIFAECKTSKGIAVAVVDASAIIHGDKLVGCADKFVSVKEVLEEVRDPVSRQRLVFLPVSVDTMDPSPEAIKKVVKFARETGDLQTLSNVDIKLIALTYMLEAQIHGTNHLRERPPPLHVVNKKYLPETQMPGWGDNVPNLAEWKALDKNSEEGVNANSRILPLKDLNGTVIPTSEVAAEHKERLDEHHSIVRTRKNSFPNREIKLDGKKMVADGVDASKGEHTDDVDDWHSAVRRSAHRRYMKRKARQEARLAAEASEQPVEEIGVTSTNSSDGPNSRDGQDSADFSNHEVFEGVHFEHESPENDEKEESDYDGKNISSVFEKLTFNVDKFDVREQENTLGISNMELKHDQSSNEEDDFDDAGICLEDDKDICERNSDNLDVSSNGDGSFITSFIDDSCSEQSGMLRSLSDSTVACITSDYAMQNVILQIGLRVLAPGGMQIRKMHRWVLRCHACNNVTQEIGKIFCPKCGNGGTLRKVSVTVDENGILLASRRQRIILRGTKYSIPLPQGGRDAITKNLILREDQLPRKLLYPKIKKKPNNKDDEFLCSDDIFSSVSEKRAPLKPPVGRTIALFSGKRNPNDNYFSRKH